MNIIATLILKTRMYLSCEYTITNGEEDRLSRTELEASKQLRTIQSNNSRSFEGGRCINIHGQAYNSKLSQMIREFKTLFIKRQLRSMYNNPNEQILGQ